MQAQLKFGCPTASPGGGRHFCMATGHNHESDVARRRLRTAVAHSENLRVTYHAQKVGGSGGVGITARRFPSRYGKEGTESECGGQICTKLPGFRRSLSDRMGFRRQHCRPSCSINFVSDSQPLHWMKDYRVLNIL